MSRLERPFVWLGGALFVASLAVCAWSFLFRWSHPSAVQVRWPVFLADALLFSVFAAHHSVLARKDIKAVLASVVPERLLRSVYVWTASVLFLIVFALWQPVGGNPYHVTGWRAVAHACIQLGGLWLIGRSVGTIDPLELAGIRRHSPSEGLQITGPYRWVRHPLYLGWLMAVFGAAHMTGDRLAFAVTSSMYLFIAIPWEERSLVSTFGKQYEDYQHQVRWRVVPFVY